jgi:hypothetical protein
MLTFNFIFIIFDVCKKVMGEDWIIKHSKRFEFGPFSRSRQEKARKRSFELWASVVSVFTTGWPDTVREAGMA